MMRWLSLTPIPLDLPPTRSLPSYPSRSSGSKRERRRDATVLPETADRPPGELGSELGHCVRQPQDLRSIDLYTLSLHDASFDGMLTFSCRRAKQSSSKQLSGIKCPGDQASWYPVGLVALYEPSGHWHR
jgi:hypothetical protein